MSTTVPASSTFGTPIENMMHIPGTSHWRQDISPPNPNYFTPMARISTEEEKPQVYHRLTPVPSYHTFSFQYPIDWTQNPNWFNMFEAAPVFPTFGKPIENVNYFGGSSQSQQDDGDYGNTARPPLVGNTSTAPKTNSTTPISQVSTNGQESEAYYGLSPVPNYLMSDIHPPLDWRQYGHHYDYVAPDSLPPVGNSHYMYQPFDSAFAGIESKMPPLSPQGQPTPSTQPPSTNVLSGYNGEDRVAHESSEGSFVCQRCNETKVSLATLNNAKYCKKCAKLEKTGKNPGLKVRRTRSVSHKTRTDIKDEGKLFTCSICDRQKQRKHYVGERLCCRECYHNNKPQAGGDENKCDNCSCESSKNYYRSRFAERLCHNCFHFKRRTGGSRPF